MKKNWYKELIGKDIYDTYRSDEEQKPVIEYGKVTSIAPHVIPGWFFVDCEQGSLIMTKLQVKCMIEKGVYHGCKIYTKVRQ